MSAKLFLLAGVTMLGMEVRAHANLLTSGNFESTAVTSSAAALDAAWLPTAASGNYSIQLESTAAGVTSTPGSSVVQSLSATAMSPTGVTSAVTSAPGGNVGGTTTALSTASDAGSVSYAGPVTLDFVGSAGAAGRTNLAQVSVETVPEFSHWAVFAGFGLLVVGFRRGRALLGALRA